MRELLGTVIAIAATLGLVALFVLAPILLMRLLRKLDERP